MTASKKYAMREIEASQIPPTGPVRGAKSRRRSNKKSPKVESLHSSLSVNALLDNRRVSANPNQIGRSRAPEELMVHRWDSTRLERPVSNPRMLRIEA